MPQFEVNPSLEMPDDDAARTMVALWEGLRDGEDIGRFITEDYLLDGSPLQVPLLPAGQAGNLEAIATADRRFPEASVRLQEVVAGAEGKVMGVLAISPGEGERGFVVYIVSEIAAGRVSRTRAYSDLRDARAALEG